MKPCYLIIDYNNVRFNDVATIRRYARERHGLTTVLVHPQPQPVDFAVADIVLDLDPKAPDFVERALSALSALGLSVKGGFPFSDRGIVGGSKLLAALGVRHDSPSRAMAALSKIDYRRQEAQAAEWMKALGAFVPAMEPIASLQDLRDFWSRHPQGLVLKPSCEGNNRGVTIVRSVAELDYAWADALPYLKDGIIAEELIPFHDEFSFDGIGSLCWVTKKLSLDGPFPVERGQQVPSFLPAACEERLKKTGRLVNELTGSSVGAFHNEIKLSPDGLVTAVVEPNRRPGGMAIWDLAEKVFGLNLYHLLVDATLGEPLPERLPEPRGVAAVRMLPAPADGRWACELPAPQLFQKTLERMGAGEAEFFGFRCLKKSSDRVTLLAKQNGDFIAQVCAFGRGSEDELQAELDRFEEAWLAVAEPMIDTGARVSPARFAALGAAR